MKKIILILSLIVVAASLSAKGPSFNYLNESGLTFLYNHSKFSTTIYETTTTFKSKSINLHIEDNFFFNKNSNLGVHMAIEILGKSIDPKSEVTFIVANGFNGRIGVANRFVIFDNLNVLSNVSLEYSVNQTSSINTMVFGVSGGAKLQYVIADSVGVNLGAEASFPLYMSMSENGKSIGIKTSGSYNIGFAAGLSLVY